MAYVYRHIRLDKNEPFYIGIGKTKYRHSAKQNRNIIWDRIVAKTEYYVEILFDDISWETATKKEIEFIKLYGRIDRKSGILANMTDGGDGNLGLVHSKESLALISLSSKNRKGHWKGKKMSEESKMKMSKTKTGKPVYKLRGRKLSEITKEAIRKRSIGNKYRLNKFHTDKTKEKISISRKEKCIIAYNRKSVFQYSIDGEYIKQYSNINEAQIQTKTNSISDVCKGYRKSANNFIWSYEYLGDTVPSVSVKNGIRKVAQYTLDGNFISEYKSINQAAKLNNFSPSLIRKYCHEKVKTAYNFKWIFV